MKTTLLDNRLILNGNLFWTVVHGYQANAYDEANRTQYLTNAGDARAAWSSKRRPCRSAA